MEIKAPRFFGLSRNVFFLGWVSFLTDVSSEMLFTLLPLFLANVLGVGAAIIGLIEGVGESTATLLKVASGWLSDRLGRRKSLAILGYAFSTAAKPFLYIATSWALVLVVRFTDRAGKGLRTSPRDALVADSTFPQERGRAFGFHRALDSLGAVVGLGGAAGVVFLLQRGALEMGRETFQTLVLLAVVPAVLAVVLLFFFVHEVRGSRKGGEGSSSFALKGFDPRFKLFLWIMVLFTLGNSSAAFLVLRAQGLGLPVLHILLLLIGFNLVYSLVSLPAGVLSDRLGRKRLIAFGWAIYVLTYLGFALAGAWWQVLVLFLFYGVYLGATEGVGRAFVADMVSAERRGTAYGLYHGAIGITALPASLIAGALWQAISPSAAFFFGAALAGMALLLLVAALR